ncbi:LysR family transcriptional regulator [Paraglaciecola hydrolytica]|uniref:LysR family transcriptional regulator n=1 Tax=Paraglaciecola hydrolytica TaxID=1799789 RepID=A0A148KLY0_9ALTE|nr:LysR family transcriptional regulator [Paraglaciecola hydrolytica]KXI27281.1 LysR family transcriptional regulator [Paraglaciecola hydrolytica]
MINPIWLRSFCTLIEEGHFTRTAQRLHMTQSGVSQHIQKLEEHFSTPLLIRQGKQFSLTDAGERLNSEAKDLLLAMDKIEQFVGSDPAYEGVVRIKSPGSIGLKLYSHLLTLQVAHPKLIIDYRFAPNAEIERSISAHNTDIGFMTEQTKTDDVICQAVSTESLVLVTPASMQEPSWQNLNSLGFIAHPDGQHHANLLFRDNYVEFEHISQIKTSGFSNQISLILEPVSLGLGFTVLPAHAVAAFHSPHLITTFALAKPVNETIYLCTARHKSPANRVKTVINEALKWL